MGIGEARNDVKQITISAMLVFERSDNFVYLNYPTKINNRIGSKYYGFFLSKIPMKLICIAISIKGQNALIVSASTLNPQ